MVYKATVLLLGVAMLMAFGLACSGSKDGDSEGGAASTGAEPTAAYEYKLVQEVDFTIEVTSTKMTRIRRIGLKYSCPTERSTTGFDFGENLSPPLAWSGVPEGAKSLVLVVTATDNLLAKIESSVAGAKAQEFTPPYPEPLAVHWIMWNIPADLTELAEAIATTTEVISIGPNVRQGLNYENVPGWTGPCPAPIGLAREYKSTQGGYNYTYGSPMRGIDDFFFRIYALDIELEGLGADTSKDDLLKAIDGHIVAAGELNGKYAQRRKF